MKVQILLCDTRKWKPLSWLIKLVQRTPYSHYAIGFTSHTGEYMVLHATSKNTALFGSYRLLSHYNIVEEYTIDIAFSYNDFCSWYELLLGTAYGYMQLFGILLNNKKLGRGIICNELVLRLLRRFTSYEDSDIDTKDLNDTLKVVKRYSER